MIVFASVDSMTASGGVMPIPQDLCMILTDLGGSMTAISA